MKNYKSSKPRYSDHYGCEVVDILKRKKIFGFIPYWVQHDTIKNFGQADEVVMLLNNPDELESRLKSGLK